MPAGLGLPLRPRVLVVTLRRLGDVLLTTPLLKSLKAGLPGSTVDTLVFRGTEGMLAGNPDIDVVHTVPQRPSVGEFLGLMRRLWRRYDLAVSTQTGDRPMALAWAAGRRRVGFADAAVSGDGWKRATLHRAVPVDADNHRVVELLRLAAAADVAPRPDLVCPVGEGAVDPPPGPYAVLHANPMFRYRRWPDEAWRVLARALSDRGLTVVATGGPDPAERAYLDRVFATADCPVERRDGRLGWPGLTALLREAAVYVGPDTSVTHLAAGSGCPTIALYGPASPHTIGPWPVGGLADPWAPAGTIQRRANVWVVQNPLPCLPCEKLGCEGHLDSYSRCLDELTAAQVLVAVDEALAGAVGLPQAHRGA